MLHLLLQSELAEGSQGPEVAALHQYLTTVGFLPPGSLLDEPYRFNGEMADAVGAFQEAYGIDSSGKLDAETLRLVRTPRCGVPDTSALDLGPRANPRCSWRTRSLRYHIAQTLPQIGREAHESAFIYALQQAANAVGLSFSPGPRGSHIQSFTYQGNGPGGTYAYAFYPCAGASAGDMYFDVFDAWSVRTPTPRNRVDFVSVCLHELGHALGLGHTTNRNAVMYAYFSFGEQRRRWQPDDLRGLRTLYPQLSGESEPQQASEPLEDKEQGIVLPLGRMNKIEGKERGDVSETDTRQ